MQSNPIVEKQQQEEIERRLREDFRYPFRVVCVYQNFENSDFPIIRDVREYCLHNHLVFVNRPYDIDKCPEDLTVNRLPAFHIYYKGYVQETYYFDVDPIHKIQILIWAYQDEMKAKERAKIRRQERWNEITESIQTFFDKFKRKPALNLEKSLSNRTVT